MSLQWGGAFSESSCFLKALESSYIFSAKGSKKRSKLCNRGGPFQGPPHVIGSRNGVSVRVVSHRNLNIRMAHDILQGLWIHASVGHIRAEGMAHSVRRHVLRQDGAVLLGVFLSHVVENIIVVGRRPGVPRPGPEEEIRIAIDFDISNMWPG